MCLLAVPNFALFFITVMPLLVWEQDTKHSVKFDLFGVKTCSQSLVPAEVVALDRCRSHQSPVLPERPDTPTRALPFQGFRYGFAKAVMQP